MALMLPRLKHSFTGLARTAPHDHGGCIALIFRRILGWPSAHRLPSYAVQYERPTGCLSPQHNNVESLRAGRGPRPSDLLEGTLFDVDVEGKLEACLTCWLDHSRTRPTRGLPGMSESSALGPWIAGAATRRRILYFRRARRAISGWIGERDPYVRPESLAPSATPAGRRGSDL